MGSRVLSTNERSANKLLGLGLSFYETAPNSNGTNRRQGLYGKLMTNTVIVNEGTPTPEIDEAFVSKFRMSWRIDSRDLTIRRCSRLHIL
jgi:hypothetical protein